MDQQQEALRALFAWWIVPMKLENNDVSRIHKFVEDVKAGRFLLLPATAALELGRGIDTTWKDVQPFVVQHDWAAAFSHASDYESMDFRLPFPRCAFEFRMSGRNVTVLASQEDGQAAVLLPFIGYGANWYCPEDKEATPAVGECLAQVKAICVALEAQVAVTQTHAAPDRLNRKREQKGRDPLRPYHVVTLRPRTSSRAAGDGTGTRKRLHFRRGHWRHYEDHTTWIKWTLVGDPDIGFIEKEYRL